MNIALFNSKSYDKDFFERVNQDYFHKITYIEMPLTAESVELVQNHDAVCIFVNDKADRSTIKKLAHCGIRIIVLRCAGFNNVDLNAAKEFGVRVFRVPSYSPQTVAEHAVALIMTLNRKTHKAYNRVRENNFSLEKLNGFTLYGKTVGVIGTGKIGSVFCSIMKGFGCKVIAYDIHTSEELERIGVHYTSFDTLLQQSDIISLHCPLSTQTKHLIDRKQFETMKHGVMLINTSRGALINTKEAIRALKIGTLGYLGIDVYEQEEHLFFNDLSESIVHDDIIARLMTFPNVLISSHQGFFTNEALEEIARTTLQNCSDYENGIETGNEL